jgi:hypothetical protein
MDYLNYSKKDNQTALKNSIKIDEDLRNFIPVLTENEKSQLETNILAEGVREPLIIWEEENILVDGHNRYEIAQKHKIDFKIITKSFTSKEEVYLWMINNQLGRRNLTLEQASYFRGKRYEREKIKQGSVKGTVKGSDKKIKYHNDTLYGGENKNIDFNGLNSDFNSDLINESTNNTAEKLAKEYDTSPITIKRDADFAKGLDLIGKENPELKTDILAGKTKISKNEIQKLAKTPEKDVLAKIEGLGKSKQTNTQQNTHEKKKTDKKTVDKVADKVVDKTEKKADAWEEIVKSVENEQKKDKKIADKKKKGQDNQGLGAEQIMSFLSDPSLSNSFLSNDHWAKFLSLKDFPFITKMTTPPTFKLYQEVTIRLKGTQQRDRFGKFKPQRRRFDAVGLVKPFYEAYGNDLFTVGFEIKVSKSDLVGDKKYMDYLGFTNYFFFVVPEELMADALKKIDGDVNNGANIGLLVVSKQGLEIKKMPKKQTPNAENEANLFREILFSDRHSNLNNR